MSKRDFSGRRWLNIGLRSLHLAGVVLAGIAIYGGGSHSAAGIALMLLTGIGMYATELWHRPSFWQEAAGLLTPAKLLTLVVMLLVPQIAGPLFWLLLITSSVVSHAPWEFRHKRILGSAG